jgi:hypothetical protein
MAILDIATSTLMFHFCEAAHNPAEPIKARDGEKS